MATTTYPPEVDLQNGVDRSGIGGHPAGLTTLFFTEMWERFSFYGLRALLILFMTRPITDGGLAFGTVKAAGIYGAYTAGVYLMSLPGGWVADNLLGARLTVLIGGIIIALGHFSMAFPMLSTFYLGLSLVVLGTGLLKPNISTMVGSLYSEDDPRRDSGFSIFYMGINLGAFIAPLVCGWLAQGELFKSFLSRMGFHPESSWHWGFAAAGIGMTLGLTQYLVWGKRLAHVGGRPQPKRKGEAASAESAPEDLDSSTPHAAGKSSGLGSRFLRYLLLLSAALLAGRVLISLVTYLSGKPTDIDVSEIAGQVLVAAFLVTASIAIRYVEGLLAKGKRTEARDQAKRLGVIFILFLFSTLFFMAFEQAGSSLNLFADRLTRLNIFGLSFQSSQLQSVNSVFIILLAPVFSLLWLKLGRREPSSPAKFAYGLLFVGIGFLVIAYASTLTGAGPVSPLWLVMVYFIHTLGELSL
ncbi:MAG TPA: peptide MFS transporter, partial [Blastocatellia bacterium]|nr:peptide MFS transporter [Blastocatellia bacterium]